MKVKKITYYLLHSVELEDGLDWPEDFLLGDPHSVLDPREHGWLNEVTLGAGAIPSALQFGTLLLATLDHLQDFIELLVVYLRSLLDVGPGVADTPLLREGLRFGHKLVVDVRLYERPGAGAAVLMAID